MPTGLAQAGRAKPNIVFILVDDMGYGDLGCYGDTFHETPNIDALARDGIKFTHAYAGAPVCSPSRGSLMTGVAAARSGLTQYIHEPRKENHPLTEAPFAMHLKAGIPTLASELKKAGYRTGMVGKWHLGEGEFLPEKFGFDVNFGGDGHGHPSWPSHYFGPFEARNLQGYGKDDYLTEVLEQKAEGFLEESVKMHKPFFLYLAHYTVHLPLGAREKMIAKYQAKNGNAKDNEPDPIYAAMIESLDTSVGNLRAKLKQLGVADNTMIILTSDNGGVGFQGRSLHRIADNANLRAGKGYLYEGGIREPLLVHWPGVTKAGTVCDTRVMFTDFMPTLTGIAGVPAPAGDGVDIAPLFRGETLAPRKSLFFHYPHYADQGGTPGSAMISGDWKLILFYETNSVELYNLKLDPTEQYNFASTFSDRAAVMLRELHAWLKETGAVLPTVNASYTGETKATVDKPGCSWLPQKGCVED